ncbi:aspartyl protease family protein At5g10770 [Oryza sativa Japonica Group]|uniref:aspartyl protease family protein At5g10770 n=1 Tax=Oryza sativa subsp. japonica TaxID=39947 RepID=UPI00339CDB03
MRVALLLLCVFVSVVGVVRAFAAQGIDALPTIAYEPAGAAKKDSVGGACTVRASSDPNRASVPLVHRHGPCAPSAASGGKPSLAERLRRDRARTNYIVTKATGGRTAATALSDAAGGGTSIPTFLGDSVNSLEYVVTLGIGTPAVQQTVLIDTGSDLSWVQCKPCGAGECYAQKDPLFDPSSSSSYASVPCDSDACRKLAAGAYGHGCTGVSGGAAALCEYGIEYGNRATTTGVYSTETLTLKPGVVVADFGFGCGDHQHGPYEKFDGLLGLGGAPESLVSQTSSQFGGPFSYCLPPTSGGAGFLTLGAPPNSSSSTAASGLSFTPMRRLPSVPTFYIVTLTGISVGGAPLAIPPSAFSSGMVIDSGTVITGLPATAYAALRSAFRSAMSEYRLLPPSNGGVLDTCYDFTGHANVTVPTISLTFSGGATIDLAAPAGVLVDGCLAFAGAGTDNAIGIIGNVNQRTFEVLYDSGKGTVGFRAGAC